MTINQEKLNASLRYFDKMGEQNLEQLKAADPDAAQQVEKLNAVLRNEEFLQRFVVCANKQEGVKLFADYGFTVTEEEVAELAAYTMKIANKLMEHDGGLSEEELEQIAGGWTWSGFIAGLASGAMMGSVIGSAGGIGIAIGAVAIGAVVGAIAGGVIGGLFFEVHI